MDGNIEQSNDGHDHDHEHDHDHVHEHDHVLIPGAWSLITRRRP
ncbi:MAG: hypothetical protein ACR2L2_15350 [Acidobacteriota bacterium]